MLPRMLQTSERLLRLLTMLQARASWPGPELAERLEIDRRTLRRDVERLRRLGYPLHATSGVAGGYRLGQGASLPPLMLDDAEGVAVALALQMAAGGTVTGMEEPSQRALAKLQRVLPARLQRRLKSLGAALVRMSDPGPTVGLDAVSALAAACSENRGVRFLYRDHHGKDSERTVEPHRLVLMGRRWYLVAWDAARRDWRTFRVDRVRAPISMGDYFTPRASPEDDLVGYVTHMVSSAPYRLSARVVLHAPFEAMRPRIGPADGVLEPIDARTCRVSMGSHSYDTMIGWLVQLDVDFHIEEPKELADRARAIGRRCSRAAHR